MSISFGSTSIKPYVGSKEVKEAYVGSQLVYRATPPYKYYFLGSENDYIIDNAVVTLNANTSITKYQNIFRIACTTSSSADGGIQLKLSTPFYLSAARSGNFNAGNKFGVNYRNSRGTILSSKNYDLPSAGQFTKFYLEPPAGTTLITIAPGTNVVGTQYLYIDNIYSEIQ